MTIRKFDSFSQYFHNWQKNIINFSLRRTLANKELENYIKSFRNIDSEIFKSLFEAKEYYNKKRRYYNQKIKKLAKQEFEFTKLLEYAYEESKKVKKPKLQDEISSSIRHIRNSIEEIDNKIYNLNETIEEQALDLDEESYIIEEIQNLDRDKQIHLRHLKKLRGDLTSEIQGNIYFKTVRTIEILEVNLKTIGQKLNKWSKRKKNLHKKMLDLYRRAREFEIIKKQIENELLDNRKMIGKNLKLFYELRDTSQKQAFQEQIKALKDKAKLEEVQILKTKYIVKKKKMEKKHTKEKLAQALEKQKSGKKLDFYELKLILEHSKQKK